MAAPSIPANPTSILDALAREAEGEALRLAVPVLHQKIKG
jgi:hypothetical protein